MRDTITIPVSSLITLANELKKDEMDYVELTILDSEEDDDGDIIPVTLLPSGIQLSMPEAGFDYDFIEHVDIF